MKDLMTKGKEVKTECIFNLEKKKSKYRTIHMFFLKKNTSSRSLRSRGDETGVTI